MLDYYLMCKPQTIYTIARLPSQRYISVWLYTLKTYNFFKNNRPYKLFWINGNFITLSNCSLHKIVFQFCEDLKQSILNTVQLSNFMKACWVGQSKGVFLNSFCLQTPQMPTHLLGCLPRTTPSHPKKGWAVLQLIKNQNKGKESVIRLLNSPALSLLGELFSALELKCRVYSIS